MWTPDQALNLLLRGRNSPLSTAPRRRANDETGSVSTVDEQRRRARPAQEAPPRAELTPSHWVLIRVVRALTAATAKGDTDAATAAIEALGIIGGDIPDRYSPDGRSRLEQLLEKIT